MKRRAASLALAAALATSLALAPRPAAAEIEKSPQDAAAEAFAKENWKEAINDYRALLQRGVADPTLYYNLGTAYARSGDKGRAVWMLLRARRLAPRDGDLRANLALLAPDLASQVAVFPIPPLEAVYSWLTLNEWAWIGWAATLALAAALFALFWARGPRASRWILRRTALAALALACVAHGFAIVKYDHECATAYGVVVGKDTHPRAAPNEGAAAYEFTLPPGTVIQLGTSGVQGWVKAIYGGRNEVFLRLSEMERL